MQNQILYKIEWSVWLDSTKRVLASTPLRGDSTIFAHPNDHWIWLWGPRGTYYRWKFSILSVRILAIGQNVSFQKIWSISLTSRIVFNIFRSEKAIDLKIWVKVEHVIPNMLTNFHLISRKGLCSTAYSIKNLGGILLMTYFLKQSITRASNCIQFCSYLALK